MDDTTKAAEEQQILHNAIENAVQKYEQATGLTVTKLEYQPSGTELTTRTDAPKE